MSRRLPGSRVATAGGRDGKIRRVSKLPELVTIYGLRDPGGRIRYVGQARDAETRLRGHLCDARSRPTHSRKNRWLARLLRRGQVPQLVILERAADPSQERAWYLRLGGPRRLLNAAPPPRVPLP